MKHASRVPRHALGLALGLGTAVVAALAMAGAAGAAVIVVTPDNNSGTDHLTPAINQANTDSSTSNTIVLQAGRFTPANEPITITKDLTIVADHSIQAVGGTPAVFIDGGPAGVKNASASFLVVNAGVTLKLIGVQLSAAGQPSQGAILDNGNFEMDFGAITGSNGNPVIVNTASSTATLNSTLLDGNSGDQVVNNGTLTLNNDSIVAGAANGINNSGTFNMTNTLMAFQVGAECSGSPTTPANGGPGSLSDDATCSIAINSDTNVDSYNYTPNTSGGAEASVILPANNPDTSGKGVSPCPVTDQRFFVNPVVGGTIQCDIGSTTTAATLHTTPPSCVASVPSPGPPATQQVTIGDTASGLGPEIGLQTDNLSYTSTNGATVEPASTLVVTSTASFPSSGTLLVTGQISGPPAMSVQETLTYTGTTATSFTGVTGGTTATIATNAPVSLIPTAYPPTAAQPVPGDSVSNVQIDNGTVSTFTPFTLSTSSPIVLTATKGSPTSKTHWSFTALNWAGIAKNCF